MAISVWLVAVSEGGRNFRRFQCVGVEEGSCVGIDGVEEREDFWGGVFPLCTLIFTSPQLPYRRFQELEDVVGKSP